MMQKLSVDLNAMTPEEQREFAVEQFRVMGCVRWLKQYPDVPLIPSELRVCPRCAETKYTFEFKLRSRAQGQTPSWCKDCVNAAAVERRQRKRDALLTGLGKRLRPGTQASKMEAVVAATVRRLGGVEAFGKATAELFQKSKGRRESLSAIRFVWQMLLIASEHQRSDIRPAG